jgi:hypothetical protein
MRDTERFADSRTVRDSASVDKDAKLLPILQDLRIQSPKDFKAILMPSLYGPEAYHLVEARGVPAKNLFAIEDNSNSKKAIGRIDVHEELIYCQCSDRVTLRGMHTTPVPCDANKAIEVLSMHARRLNERVDLAYLDFTGQPDYKKHMEGCVYPLVKHVLKPDSTLILTFVHGRTTHEVKTANIRAMLCGLPKYGARIGFTLILPTELYVHKLFERLDLIPDTRSVTYRTSVTNRVSFDCLTTVVKLGEGG